MSDITEHDPHRETDELLPWYVKGQLAPDEQERVERHLTDCAQCERKLRIERRLADDYRAWAPEIERGWQRLRNRIEASGAHRSAPAGRTSRAWRAMSRPMVAAAMAAQLAIIVAAGAIAAYVYRPASYSALGSVEAPASADLIVIFKPETREEQMRHLLGASDASLVGGPTEADAYLLHVPEGSRAKTVETLRSRPEIVMAEPIDGESK